MGHHLRTTYRGASARKVRRTSPTAGDPAGREENLEVRGNADSSDDEFGTLYDNVGEQEIVRHLLRLSEAASAYGEASRGAGGEQQLEEREQDSFRVTDIEDYEPPQGVRLPAVLGLDQTRLSGIQPAASQGVELEILRGFEAESGE